ncbi:hypothetical protein NIES4101_32790 [Calothrix sp. NIES-4101]|nr:hypothetical protein NIES4101_32790 [Calothrix sp. NIES-4101]
MLSGFGADLSSESIYKLSIKLIFVRRKLGSLEVGNLASRLAVESTVIVIFLTIHSILSLSLVNSFIDADFGKFYPFC